LKIAEGLGGPLHHFLFAYLGFEVLTAVGTKMAVFWAAMVALMMEAARSSETLVNFYQTTRRYNPEDSHIHFCLLFNNSNALCHKC
jgi:hypothetical protein